MELNITPGLIFSTDVDDETPEPPESCCTLFSSSHATCEIWEWCDSCGIHHPTSHLACAYHVSGRWS